MSATLCQLTCPACAQPFLSRQQHALSVQVCPHCAFTAAAGQFLSQTGPAGSPMDIRRRQPRPANTPAVNPSGWEIRDYPAIVPKGRAPAAPQPPVTGGLAAARPVQTPVEPNWEAAQAYADSLASPLAQARLTAASEPTVESPSPQPEPTPPLQWSPMKPSVPPKLSSWPGMTPPTHDQDSDADFVPKKQRSYVWPIVTVLLMLVVGVITALVMESQHRAANRRSTLSETKTEEPMIKSAIPISVPVQLPPESRLAPDDAASQIQALLKRLFAATTTDERLACIGDARHNRASVEAFFGKLSTPLEITKFRTLNAPALLFPDSHPIVLCEVQTTYPGHGTAIARLVSESDGSLRLHWPTLLDSLEARLYHFSKNLPDAPMWVTIGLRRNFGFEETESLRAEHFVFDIQGLGSGDDRTIVFAAKDQPIGRSLDHLATWNQLYMVRALVNCVPLEGRKRITLLDAELAGADDLRQ